MLITAPMTGAHQDCLNQYKLKPILFDAKQALADGLILFAEDESITLNLGKGPVSVTGSHYYDLLIPTMFGLNEALVAAEEGVALRREFEIEFNAFNQCLEVDGHARNHGCYVFYPDCGDLVQFAPPRWHHLSLLAANAQLLRGPGLSLSWEEVRNIHAKAAPAIAGASVGSKIADSLLKVLRPEVITIADPAVYKLTNANRTDIGYADIVYSRHTQAQLMEQGEFAPYGMKNKAVSFALKSQKIDPYLTVFPFSQGITNGNVGDFVSGAGVVVEEVDMSFDMDIKLAIRSEARNQKKFFIMVSDLGSWVQWDIRPFHLKSNIPLFLDYTDEQIFKLNREARSGKDGFFRFMEGLIGPYFWSTGELGETFAGRLPRIVGSLPQLGSTTSMAAGIAAEFVARILLGFHDIYERGIVDLRNQEVRTYGKKIGDV